MAAPPFKVKAVYEYASEHDDDLNFPIGQVITVKEQEGDDWYVGEYMDSAGTKQEGLFPTNFVEKYEPEVPTRPTRPARPKSEVLSVPASAAEPEQVGEEEAEEELPPVPAASKPQPPPVDIPATAARQEEEVRSPPSATLLRSPPAREEPPPAPKPVQAEPAQPEAASAKPKPPPPVAPKSNAFKDRIAAFNRAEAAPIAPIQPGKPATRNEYIKKPFVADPPSRHAYIPPVQKSEPVHKPYIREEDPEIKRKQDEDRQAAEAAGLAVDEQGQPPANQDAEEDAPKPMSLKERMALLQKEQEAQRTRHAESAPRKEKKPPVKKSSESSDRGNAAGHEEDELERASTERDRRSLDVQRDRPRVPSAQRRPAEPMSPVPAVPEHEILSGGEEADQSAAGDTTEDETGTIGPDDSDERAAPAPAPLPPPRAAAPPAREPDVGNEEDTTDDAGEDEEEELDEEEQRKQRLRERMARLAGGQQGGGPFNPFGMPPSASAPTKKRSAGGKQASGDSAPTSSSPPGPQMIAIPGMGGTAPPPRVQSPHGEAVSRDEVDEETEVPADDEEYQPQAPPRKSTTMERDAPPTVPKEQRPIPPAPFERGAPPPLPSDSTRPIPRPPQADARPLAPPPPSAVPMSPGPGSESDDEMSLRAKRSSAETSGLDTPLPIRSAAPPVPTAREVPPRPPQSADSKRASYFSSEPSSATSEKRTSRLPPPVPGVTSPTSPRPPPPPPPTAVPPSRRSTDLQPPQETERGESDYEGDYDTDIASSAKHKDALKTHARESSLDDTSTADEMTPVTTPQQLLPRSVPPPPPSQAPPKSSRQSIDAPRAAPPPLPPMQQAGDDEEYDPYRYTNLSREPPPPVPGAIPVAAPPIPPLEVATGPGLDESDADEDEEPPAPPTRKSTDRAPPPPPHSVLAPPLPSAAGPLPQQGPPTARAPPRQSVDVQRPSNMARRSMDTGRPSGEFSGQMAQDLDLAPGVQWWTAPQPLPPMLQNRNGVEILSESEESQKSKRGGRTTISKDIYVLYMDYSQTVITVQYDSKDPADVTLEQRHESPPPKLRQDQLETFWQRFGKTIADKASAAGNVKKDSVVIGDGSAASLPLELIRQHPEALLPVGAKAYGALVYANLANASTMQFDEIRPGDIVTIRNGRFEGHHGAMKSKYKIDYGPQHVGVVEEWDGTRRSVRMWEQGRDSKSKEGKGKGGGVRSEKLRLGDLRSGEVRVWRVVGREWVGWDN